ncbi:MAG TPA: hypothetical protein VFW81_03120 [Thermoanaerobaculia bacterium]|nr:hypothetical protein [Thermoanaerobaculia bacterium]
MRVAVLSGLVLALLCPVSRALPEKAAAWPLSLRDGLPTTLPGYAAAPRDPLPDSDENEMGTYTEVSRFFQRIESSTSVKQFRLVVQDYGPGKDLAGALKKAVAEAARAPNVEARELTIANLPAFAVTDRSGGNPTTLVTVIASPNRLVLAQGANVERDEAVKLLGRVDFQKVIDAK